MVWSYVVIQVCDVKCRNLSTCASLKDSEWSHDLLRCSPFWPAAQVFFFIWFGTWHDRRHISGLLLSCSPPSFVLRHPLHSSEETGELALLQLQTAVIVFCTEWKTPTRRDVGEQQGWLGTIRFACWAILTPVSLPSLVTGPDPSVLSVILVGTEEASGWDNGSNERKGTSPPLIQCCKRYMSWKGTWWSYTVALCMASSLGTIKSQDVAVLWLQSLTCYFHFISF